MKENLLIAAVLLGWAANAWAAPITLETCLQRADQKSSIVKSFEKAAQAANESLVISRTSFYPTLKLKAGFYLVDHPQRLIIDGNAFAPGVPPQDVSLSTGDRDSYNIGLYLQQPLYTGGALTQNRRRAEFQLQAAQSDTLYQRSQTAQLVKKAFADALAARLQAQALQKALTASKEQTRVVEERLQEGHARREDLLSAQLDVSRAEAAWAQGDNQAEMALTTLRKLIYAAPEEPLEPVGALTKVHLSAPLSELLSLGLKQRADLSALQARAQQGSAEVAVARSAFYPQLSLVGSYLRQTETAIARSDVWTIGAQAEWSLFEWGRTSAEVRRAAAWAEQDVLRQDEAGKSAQLEIEQYWRGMKDGEAQLRAAEAQQLTREFAMEKVLDRFQEGYLKRADVLSAEAALWDAHAAYVRSAADLNATLANLQRATGAALDPWLEFAPLKQPAFATIAERIGQAAPPKTPTPQAPAAAAAQDKLPAGQLSAPETPSPAPVAPTPAPAAPTPAPVAPMAVPVAPMAAPVAPMAAPVTPMAATPVAASATPDVAPASPAVMTSAADALSSPVTATPAINVVKLSLQSQGTEPREYLVQLGAFKSYANARRTIKSLSNRAEGTPQPTIFKEAGMFKVQAGPFENKDAALRAAANFGAKEYLVKVIHGP